MFADQFEPNGTGFIYRKSQKGEAISISADERSRFVDDFDRRLRRAKWILYLVLAIAMAALVAWIMKGDARLSQVVIFAGVGAMMLPYLAYYHWAWGAPARELTGRTPIAGERSSEEVQRIRLRRITYPQLAGIAFAGLVIPLAGLSQNNLFTGWDRLWLLSGVVLVVIAAVQAFRKWQFDQTDSLSNSISPSPATYTAEPSDDSGGSPFASQLWRYVPLGVLVLGGAFIGFTDAGKRIAQKPSFFVVLMLGFATWSLVTVAWGLAKGRIQPFARGFYRTYERDTEPKRYWASIAWNAAFGGFFFWLALTTNIPFGGQPPLQIRCYNGGGTYSVREVDAACDQLFAQASAEIRAQPNDANAFFNRGFVNEHRGDLQNAIADFSRVIQLRPNDPGAYYYRWAAYKDLGDDERANADLATLKRLSPQVAATLQGNRVD